MRPRPNFFLASENIDHDGIIFDYIKELHEYLWRFVRVSNPAANGRLCQHIDKAIEDLEKRNFIKIDLPSSSFKRKSEEEDYERFKKNLVEKEITTDMLKQFNKLFKPESVKL